MADIIITGPPRSGTSYLCTILNGVSNWVVLNEPPEAYQAPIKMRRAFRLLRDNISVGLPIKNKMHQGKFIEDTAEVNTYEEYVPRIENGQFHLAMKCPMIFMMMLPRIIEVMPDMVKIVSIRNPIDTIASWKNSFSHLDGPTEQQAQMWTRQAQRILRHRSALHILVYERWIEAPAEQLGQIPRLFSNEQLAGLPTSTPRIGKRESLSDEDIGIIQTICGEAADQLEVPWQ